MSSIAHSKVAVPEATKAISDAIIAFLAFFSILNDLSSNGKVVLFDFAITTCKVGNSFLKSVMVFRYTPQCFIISCCLLPGSKAISLFF